MRDSGYDPSALLMVFYLKVVGIYSHQGDSAFGNHLLMSISDIKYSRLSHYDSFSLVYDF